MDNSKSVVVVSLAINTGSHTILGTDRKTLYFDAYPKSSDIRDVLGDDVKFVELLNLCEADDVAEYQADYVAADNFIGFECYDDKLDHVGSIVIEQQDLNTSSVVVI